MIKRIDHINISVTNLEKASQFFTELLGFRLMNEAVLEGEWIDKVTGLSHAKARFVQLGLPGAETNIELIEYDSPKGKKDPEIHCAQHIGFRHLAFEVSNIEEVYKRLHSAGIPFFSEIQTTPRGKKICYFKGPDDIILELAAYENPKSDV